MIYVFAADGFEEIEFIAPVDMLRRAGGKVTVVGITGTEVTGSHGVCIKADATPEQVDLSDAELLVLPGGSRGVDKLFASGWVKNAVLSAVKNGTPVGAICAAPSILQRLGLLEKKKFTCYPGCENNALPGVFTGEAVVTDGIFTTSRGAGTALLFGRELVSRLYGAAAAAKLWNAIKA